MNDSFVNALNTQKSTSDWIDAVSENLMNIYTPGYRETQASFQTFLDSAIIDGFNKKTGQGKSIPEPQMKTYSLRARAFSHSDATTASSFIQGSVNLPSTKRAFTETATEWLFKAIF